MIQLMIPIFSTDEFVGTLDLLTNRVFFWHEMKRDEFNLGKRSQSDPDFEVVNVVIDYSKIMLYASAHLSELNRVVRLSFYVNYRI